MLRRMTMKTEFSDPAVRAVIGAGDIAYDWDIAGDRIRWFGNLVFMLGETTSRRAATGRGFAGQVHPEDRPFRQIALTDHLAKNTPFDCAYRLSDGAGGYRWVSDRGNVDRDGAGKATRMFGIIRSIDALKAEELRLSRLAFRDDLTGLASRVRLVTRLDKALRSLNASGGSGGLIVIGIDQLGMVNDVFGYPSGDAVLVEAAKRLSQAAGAGAVIGRIAGDRFAVVLGNATAAQTEIQAEKLLASMRGGTIETPGGDLRVTASVGWVALPAQARSARDAFAKAESALAEVKRAGRDAVAAYRESTERRRAQRIDLAVVDLIERSLTEGRVELAFQPIVDSSSREIRHYEALLRVGDDFGGMLNAGAVVPTAESMGLMRRLDAVVLDRAIDELERHPDVALAINVSAVNAGRGSWIDLLVERIGTRTNLSGRLTVEITETVALIDPAETARFIETIHKLGARVAIDDFGAGNTSFRALRRLGVDVVKIDGSFVSGIAENADNRLFVRALVGIARGFGLATVAEFVETEEEARILLEEGVEQLQGFLFGRPQIARPWIVAPPPPVNSRPMRLTPSGG
jgi:diguanylate cyclase (GGDEF)-like protein